MIFLVPVVVPHTLAKQKEHYMKGQLNMLGLTITALLTNSVASMTAQVFNICWILRLRIRHFLRHQHLFKTLTNLSDCNWTRTHNHLVHKGTLNHLAKLAK